MFKTEKEIAVFCSLFCGVFIRKQNLAHPRCLKLFTWSVTNSCKCLEKSLEGRTAVSGHCSAAERRRGAGTLSLKKPGAVGFFAARPLTFQTPLLVTGRPTTTSWFKSWDTEGGYVLGGTVREQPWFWRFWVSRHRKQQQWSKSQKSLSAGGP